MGLLDSFRKRLRADPDQAEKPSHHRRILELEQRADDLEAEMEKVSRTVRTWFGRIAKREAMAAQKALEAAPAVGDGEEPQPQSDVQHMSKQQLRQAYSRGAIRKIGGVQ